MVEQNSPYLDVDDDDLTAYHLYGLDSKNNIIAYSRFMMKDKDITFGRVVIPKSLRGKGLGNILVSKTLDNINNIYGNTNIRIEAQYHAIDFYKNFGFIVNSEPFLDAGVKHVDMKK